MIQSLGQPDLAEALGFSPAASTAPRPWPARVKDEGLPALREVFADSATRWSRQITAYWYGEQDCLVHIASAMVVWYHKGAPASSLRRVLIGDPLGQFEKQALLCTDLQDTPAFILDCFV